MRRSVHKLPYLLVGGWGSSKANRVRPGPGLTASGIGIFTSTRRTFAATPLDKALSYAELLRQLNSPGNGLGGLYQVDLQALGLERPWR